MPKASLSRDYIKKLARGLSANEIKPVQRLSTFNVGLDYITCGGVPLGGTTELAGPTHSYKSSTALYLHRVWNEHYDLVGSYSDVERTVKKNDIERLIGNLDIIDILYPSSAEMFVESVRQAAQLKIESDPEEKSGYYSIMTLDSIAALAPLAEREIIEQRIAKDEAISSMAMRKAAFWSAVQPSFTDYVGDSELIVLMINQARQSMNPYGPPVTTPGGSSIPFMCSLRLLATCSGKPSDEAKSIKALQNSIKVKWRVIKNKTGERERAIELDYTGNGPDPYTALIRVAKELGILQKGSYKLNPIVVEESGLPQTLGAGIEKAYNFLKDPANEEVYKLLYKECLLRADNPLDE
ncbi:hypothetical protein ACQ4M3_09410 [Leptolyngbya sp. AN03gr2]|uniref:hypothetical protein n=1 Tax=Leptolyngbya sp. AN03gr2 TaxID=3423364 RepID=UPI003D3140FE